MTNSCCVNFTKAQEKGSDTTGDSRALRRDVWYGRAPDPGGGNRLPDAEAPWTIGTGLPPIAFCPWGGNQVDQPLGVSEGTT